MIPQRKPVPANRRTRRAQGIKLVKVKRGGPPTGPSPLIDAFRRVISDNDLSVGSSAGLMAGEKGWVFHRGTEFTYAVTEGKTRVTLHVMPMYYNETIHRTYRKLMDVGDFGQGCIRFKKDAQVDLELIARLIRDCAKV